MKRLGLIVVVLIVAVVLYRPAESRDTYGERISDLETRVAVLEGQTLPTSPAGATVTITGLLPYGDADGESFVPVGAKCVVEEPSGLFLADTLPMTVTNEVGAVIGTSELLPGFSYPYSTLSVSNVCAFPFEIDGLPAAEFYTITIGFRPEDVPPVTVSAEDLELAGYRVVVPAGDLLVLEENDLLTPQPVATVTS